MNDVKNCNNPYIWIYLKSFKLEQWKCEKLVHVDLLRASALALSTGPSMEILDKVLRFKSIGRLMLLPWKSKQLSESSEGAPWNSPINKTQPNRTYWLVHVSEWLDCLIGPGGLLLVVSHVFAVPISVLWVGLEKSK